MKRKLTHKEKEDLFDNLFNKPLSERGVKVPDDYNPPVQKEDETLREFMRRVSAYDAGYYSNRK